MNLTCVLLSVIIGLCSLFFYILYRNLNYWKVRGIPHDQPHFMFGTFKGKGTKYHERDIYRAQYEKYKGKGPFVGFYFFQAPMALITDMTLMKNILIKDFSNFMDRPAYYNEKHDPLSAHLFNLDNPKWKELRHKLSPTFTSGKMKFMFPTLKTIGEQFVSVMQNKATSNVEGIVDVKEMFARFTTDVIGSCAFGIECNSLTDPKAEFRLYGKQHFEEFNPTSLKIAFGVQFPKLANHMGIRITSKPVTDFFMNAVKDTVVYREKNHVRRNDFMDMLIDLKAKSHDFNIEQLAAQAFVFYIGGFETSSALSGFVLYELSRHQDMQDKVRTEIWEVLEKHNNEMTYESLAEMKYLDQIIWETLRHYTIVSSLVRRAKEDYIVNDKYIIEKGISVIIPATAIHMDPDLYPNPTEFNPDNFTTDKINGRDSFAMLGFGEGPRNCIGLRFGQMQARLGLAMLLNKFKFSICSKTKMNIDNKKLLVSTKEEIFLKTEFV